MESSPLEELEALLASRGYEQGKQEREPEDTEDTSEVSEPAEKIDGPLGDGECVICGAPTFRPEGLTRGGQRRRVPKFCEDHNPKTRVTPAQAERSSALKTESRLKALHTDLADNIRLVGALAGPVLPVTGYIILEDAEAFTQAALNLAKRHPKIIGALEKAAQVGPGITIGRFMVKLGVAMNVDSGRMQPDSAISNMMGVYAAWQVVHPDLAQANGTTATSPPRYSVVQ